MKKPYLKYILALLLFGTNGIVASHIALTSHEIVFLRTLIGSLLLFIIFLSAKCSFTFFQYKKESVFLAISGIAMGTSWMFLYEAYQQIGVGIASLAYYCGPVIVMVLSPFIFQEQFTCPKIVGFMIVLIGIFLVNIQAIQEGTTGWGIFCGAMSAIMYSLMVIFNKKASSITGLENALLQLTVSFLTVAVFLFFKQGFNHIGISNWLPILVLGLLNTGIGCYLYFSSMAQLQVQTVAICGYLEPLTAVIFSVVFLHEIMGHFQIIGGLMILGGAIIGECTKS